MNNPDSYIIQTVRNNNPYPTRQHALNALDTFTGHRIGQIITLLYHSGINENLHDVHALVAVGVKNANECGSTGQPDVDKWNDKFYPDNDYPNGPCGREFYRIISDTGERDIDGVIIPSDYSPGQGGGCHCEPLYNTTITTVNKTHVVKNPYDCDIELEDPFVFKPLDEDSREIIDEN